MTCEFECTAIRTGKMLAAFKTSYDLLFPIILKNKKSVL